MDFVRLIAALGLVVKEAERRKAGEPPDRRFDLAIDATLDLMDVLRPPRGADPSA